MVCSSRRYGRIPAAGIVAIALALALALAGCSGDDDSSPSAEPSTQASASQGDSTRLVQRFPLTGRVAKKGLPDRAVAVVKVDNTANARPQVGLAKADIVVEELVEGGATRLAAMYHTRTPKKVGPVRSLRDTDVGIVKPAEGALIASGGATQTVRRMKKADVRMFTEGSGTIGLDTAGSRSTPYDRILDLNDFADKLAKVDRRPQHPYLPFAEPGRAAKQTAGTKAPKRLSVQFSPAHATRWAHGNGAWTRRNGLTRDGGEFRADNLLVLRARVTGAGYTDAAGSRVPKTVFKGRGRAVLFHGRQKVQATWSKKSLGAPLKLRRKGGKPVRVPPGRTWIELVPKDAKGITG